jgi:hypothetical protein
MIDLHVAGGPAPGALAAGRTMVAVMDVHGVMAMNTSRMTDGLIRRRASS